MTGIWDAIKLYVLDTVKIIGTEIKDAKYTVDFGVQNGLEINVETPKGWSLDLILEKTLMQTTPQPVGPVIQAQSGQNQPVPNQQNKYKAVYINLDIGRFNYTQDLR